MRKDYKDLKRLYNHYLEVSANEGKTPVEFDRFSEFFTPELVRMGVGDVGNVQEGAVYVAASKDLSSKYFKSIKKVCGQCGGDAYVVNTMLPKLHLFKHIICDSCLYEVSGKTMAEHVRGIVNE